MRIPLGNIATKAVNLLTVEATSTELPGDHWSALPGPDDLNVLRTEANEPHGPLEYAGEALAETADAVAKRRK